MHVCWSDRSAVLDLIITMLTATTNSCMYIYIPTSKPTNKTNHPLPHITTTITTTTKKQQHSPRGPPPATATPRLLCPPPPLPWPPPLWP